MPLIFPYGWRRALDLRERRVEREMLDHLPPSHPDARSSRSDLYWLNVLMGNFRWLRGEIGRLLKGRREPLRVLELGAGDGSLPYTFPRHWRRRVVWTGIDRFGWPCSERLMGWTRWVQGDARRIEWPD
ncbi:MAG: hypothetical protein N2322_03155, partial [Terrimicrobiaceae bacterium]|nr:hypothetical protein [Terrimicrobiaceae bacterium]